MRSNETFEAIAHPLRIKILKLLAEKPMSFSELKRRLMIKSSGKLDFHLKKLRDLITIDSDGKYTLTKEGYSALQATITIEKYGWQKRAYILSTVAYIMFVSYVLWNIMQTGVKLTYLVVLMLVTSWYAFYSYWNIMRRRIFRTY